jgi:hypothetical protein
VEPVVLPGHVDPWRHAIFPTVFEPSFTFGEALNGGRSS